MFVEYVSRKTMAATLAMSLATFFGAFGLAYAAWHETAEGFVTAGGADTMQPLVAVLDTNFYLSTHVTAVTLGYLVAFLAALMGNVYIVAKFIDGFGGGQTVGQDFYKNLSRMLYGVLCFGVLFSTFGTIWGGVWANDSWGRFWGWDPKENGALMLVLGFLAILHGRMGGYLRQHGIAVASVALGTIVMWAFLGVNLYSIGLHSYGFDETKMMVTRWYYGTQWTMVGVGIFAFYLPKLLKRPG
jgi:cytochrome c biogenesis factor